MRTPAAVSHYGAISNSGSRRCFVKCLCGCAWRHPTFYPLSTLSQFVLMYNIPAEKRKSFVMLLKQDKRNKNTLIKNVRCLLCQPPTSLMLSCQSLMLGIASQCASVCGERMPIHKAETQYSIEFTGSKDYLNCCATARISRPLILNVRARNTLKTH